MSGHPLLSVFPFLRRYCTNSWHCVHTRFTVHSCFWPMSVKTDPCLLPSYTNPTPLRYVFVCLNTFQDGTSPRHSSSHTGYPHEIWDVRFTRFYHRPKTSDEIGIMSYDPDGESSTICEGLPKLPHTPSVIQITKVYRKGTFGVSKTLY